MPDLDVLASWLQDRYTEDRECAGTGEYMRCGRLSDWAEAVGVALCARVLWHWWRRRRQGKPSRVLGLVRDLGHRLTVVHVPAKEGA